MYTFNIETIHNKNMVIDNKMIGEKKIVGGAGKQFKVYRASDINKLFDFRIQYLGTGLTLLSTGNFTYVVKSL